MPTDQIESALVGLAGWDLGTVLKPVDPIVATAAGIAAGQRHKLIGVMAGALGHGALEVDEDERAAVTAAHRTAMAEVLLLDRELIAALEIFEAAAIDYRVLKGVALAQTVWPDPSERYYGDNDVIVRADQIDEAVARLLKAGATRPQPPLSADFDRRFAKSVTLRWRSGTEIDVHRTLAPGPYGIMVNLDDLFADSQSFDMGPRTALTFPNELQLLHAALHVALGDVEPTLGNLRDLALLLADPELDTDAVIRTAELWSATAPVAAGLRRVSVLHGPLNDLTEWAGQVEVSALDERRLATYQRAGSRFRGQVPESIRALPTWADRLAYGRAVVMPQRAILNQRGINRWQYIKSRWRVRW